MDDKICDRCAHVFLTGWRRFSLLGNGHRGTRPGWPRRLSRVCHFTPCLVYEGTLKQLKPTQCPMCTILDTNLKEAARRGTFGMLDVSKKPGGLVVHGEVGFVERLWHRVVGIRLYKKNDAFRIRFELDAMDSEVTEVQLSSAVTSSSWFKLFADHDSPAASFIPRRPNLWDTSSDVTFAFIHRWLSECDSGHECISRTATKMPKRLLDLLSQPSTNQLKLVDTALLTEYPRYAALSYCWGNPKDHPQTKTLMANVAAYHTCIEFGSLPRTIQDAISCCRKLGIQFLWVDALCIIQDSNADKMSEIEAMGYIYANAYLTIAASKASGSNDGFLEPRDNPYFSAPIPCPGGGMADVKWSLRGNGLLNSSKMVLTKAEGYMPAKELEPLYSRGWTFQEAMLSKRTLFFSFFQPYFVCQASCKAGGEPSPGEYFNAVDMREMFPSVARGVPTSRYQAPPMMEMGYEWPWVAETYSSRVLSVLEDKALAIRAITNQYEKRHGEYISGLWSQNLAVDLLWSTVSRHTRTDDELRNFGSKYRRSLITSLPSWSWLSFDGSVRFEVVWHAFYLGKIRHISDISKRIQLMRVPSADIFGRVTGEPLRLRGVTKKVLVIPPMGPGWENQKQSRSCYEIRIWDEAAGAYNVDVTRRDVLERRIGETAMDEFVTMPMTNEESTWPDRRKAFSSENDYDAVPRILDCFVVAMVGDRTGDRVLGTKPRGYSLVSLGDEIAYGLLVEDVPGSKGTKRRIGLFRGDEGRGFYFDDAVEVEFDMI